MLLFIYKALYKIFILIYQTYSYLFLKLYLNIFNIKTKGGLKTNGKPDIYVAKTGLLEIGDNFRMNNGRHFNQIGRNDICHLLVGDNARLVIGNNVGISSTTIICQDHIVIGNGVRIGGNTVIYDTDFHSLNPRERAKKDEDKNYIKKRKVCIGDNVFIGAHSTILKGVDIGRNSVIGACSLVTKSIPENEVWAGNPAKFIRKVEVNE